MYLDPRGGHNRKEIDVNFFKKWSADMSYLLGFIAADGAIEDVRKSSRTCYLSILSTDLEILLKFKAIMKSNHNIYVRDSCFKKFGDKIYKTSKAYILRIGSKEIVQDLINLGLTPRKSLRLKMPDVPSKYLSHFLRGYFDGDGCINLHLNRNRKTFTIKLILVSGTKSFLESINKILKHVLNIEVRKISYSSGVYRLTFQGKLAMKIFDFMYKHPRKRLCLNRKYEKYLIASGIIH